MFKRIWITILFLLALSGGTAVFAQSAPEISVELVPSRAEKGEIVTANVWVRNGVNVAGADVGIEVDACLKVNGRTQGGYLPDGSSGISQCFSRQAFVLIAK